MKSSDSTELEMLYESILDENSLTTVNGISNGLKNKQNPLEIIKKMTSILHDLEATANQDEIFNQIEKALIDLVNSTAGYKLVCSIEWGKTPTFFEDVVYAIKNNKK
jgi:flagellin-specific chaperone FliS